MKRIRYTMSARSQSKLYAQRQRLVEKDVHRWVFVCDLQVMYMPHIVLNNTPPLSTTADTDEVVTVDAVCGWPFCLYGLGSVNDAGGGAM